MSRIAGENMVALSMNEATDTANAVTMNTVWLRDDARASSLLVVCAAAG
jgi:hypothetical protein